ncbi:NAD(P)H-binding protein [Streptomyces sp. NPDC048409]|uniref:NAD(P)H-binding protein n=1 Tax=Streptomyces sp. NPDC048409 TaxID=3154723 RepID=UPI0034326BEE
MRMVVTGASGKLGKLVIEGLLAEVSAERIVAVVRDPAKAASLAAAGVEVQTADYNEPGTLNGIFREGDVVLLISGSEIGRRVPHHAAVVEAAERAGVARIAYTSLLGCPQANFALADEHKATEQIILDSGVPYTLLRNAFYTEVYTDQIPAQLEHGLVGSAADGRIGSATRADLAAAAVAVLVQGGHENRAYELSGDEAWTLTEYATELARQTGKPVKYVDVPGDVYKGILEKAGLPSKIADMLVNVDVAAVAAGLAEGGGDDLGRLIGRPTTRLAEAIAAKIS